jgi:hypothetical protein
MKLNFKGNTMKIWKVSLGAVSALLLLSGCNNAQTVELQNKNAKQALLIQKQQAEIEELKKTLAKKKKVRRKKVPKRTTTRKLPPKPKKNIKLKKVEDNNYSSSYMYPGAQKPKPKVTAPKPTTTSSTTTSMGKPECIAMIGQAKFDKYTKMFGSEAASIKRCNMLKAMR